MGAAEILPGISGSTTALIMGIYDDFINLLYQISITIKLFLEFIIRKASFKEVKESFFKIDFKFGIPIILGMIFAIITLSHALIYLLENNPHYIFAFFFGLGLSSVTIPYKEMKTKSLKNLIIVIVSFVIAFMIFGLKAEKIDGSPSYLILFLSGIVGVTGTILPGASGSYLLIITGVYDYVVKTIKDFSTLNISVEPFVHLSIFTLGLLVGFIVLVRLVKAGLKNHHDEIMAMIIGVMLGALRVTYPFVSNPEDQGKDYYTPFSTHDEYSVLLVWLSFFSSVAIIFLMNQYSDRNQFEKVGGKDQSR
jgi:putative membrane protein